MGTAQQGIHPGMLTQAQTEQVLRMAAAQAQVSQTTIKFLWKCLLTKWCSSLLQQQQQHAQQRGGYNQRSQIQNQMANRQQYQAYNNNGLNLGTINSQQGQQPPPLVRATPQNQAHL